MSRNKSGVSQLLNGCRIENSLANHRRLLPVFAILPRCRKNPVVTGADPPDQKVRSHMAMYVRLIVFGCASSPFRFRMACVQHGACSREVLWFCFFTVLRSASLADCPRRVVSSLDCSVTSLCLSCWLCFSLGLRLVVFAHRSRRCLQTV